MNIYNQIDSNRRKSILLIGFFLIMIVGLGWFFSFYYKNEIVLYLAVIISVTQALISYYSGDKIALAASGAREISKKDNPLLWNTVENLCIAAGILMPKVYIIDDPMPNAFATGRDPKHASIAVTSGLLQAMNKDELEGVIAHELSHIRNYDILVMTTVVVLVGVIAIVSDLFLRMQWFGFGDRDDRGNGGQGQAILLIIGIVAAILAPIIATLVQLAVSRKREFLADSSGALLTRYPEGLASALEKINHYSVPMKKVSSATSHLYIANPMGKKESYFQKILSTHPPVKERIAALRKMGK